MKIDVLAVVLAAGALILGAVVGYLLRKVIAGRKISQAEEEARRIIASAHKESESIIRESRLSAKDELFAMRKDLEKEYRERKDELKSMERRLTSREESIEKKMDSLERREGSLSKREKEMSRQENKLNDRMKKYEALLQEQSKKLESLAGMSSAEAKEALLKEVEQESRREAAHLMKRIETDARESADKKAKEIISLAVKRYAGDYVAEKTVSVVNLPNEEMKGRIIGREGRNIRALEAKTGVDLIIDDTPEAVILSAFNPVRREVARLSLERLISDGRIHPGRIEEIVDKVDKEIAQAIKEAGEGASFDVGVHGIHPEIIKLLGKLKYRSSYGQNVLVHSIEVSFLCGIMASELKINEKRAKRAGLLHDIGKAVDHEVEGPHALIGAELANRYGESPKVVHAVAAHHEDMPPNSILAVLVQAADALSGARPGARRELLETYVKRLKDLERIANSFKGIDKSYAIQAGREVRIIVNSNRITDEDAVLLSRDIAKKIEDELTYPGQVKVTVIRETRSVNYAK